MSTQRGRVRVPTWTECYKLSQPCGTCKVVFGEVVPIPGCTKKRDKMLERGRRGGVAKSNRRDEMKWVES